MKNKLTSRKLWVAIVGVATGILSIVCGEATHGTAIIISSVLGYLLAEGLIDAMAVEAVLDVVEEVDDLLDDDKE